MIDTRIIEMAKQSIINQDKNEAVKIVNQCVADNVDIIELMDSAYIPGINYVGDQFGRGKMYLPELIQAADAMKAVTEVVDAAIPENDTKARGTIAIGTVKGDVHDIGKCIVVSLLKANGFVVHDLGRDLKSDFIVEKAVELNADIIGTSALLTTTMPRQQEMEDQLRQAGLREKFKTIVGGAPVTKRWADKIGADAYGEDAQDTVAKCRQLIGEM